MIVVGEPNQFFVYTSNGICGDDWTPGIRQAETQVPSKSENESDCSGQSCEPPTLLLPPPASPEAGFVPAQGPVESDALSRVQLPRAKYTAVVTLKLSVTADATMSRSAVQHLLSVLITYLKYGTQAAAVVSSTQDNARAADNSSTLHYTEDRDNVMSTSEIVAHSFSASIPEAQVREATASAAYITTTALTVGCHEVDN
eukprot:CAMPEP_0177756380 /NCGR_PEP_ID=MMETSP0491_2-20121128/3073_1 /TAXON_ID=63592 /ORGANISM="Tetraselmis chuii, Strain PLY429" /LENGTH=199 /DNA_ID=CAMNT_0019271949 /DNA_START=1016 /DNA_END=1616 /DNA_ORIENTATION=-